MRIRAVTTTGARSGHAADFRPYVWRDPARCSAERLAELAAHDDYIRALDRLWSKPEPSRLVRRAA